MFCVFDSHARNNLGQVDSAGSAVLLVFSNLKSLYDYLFMNYLGSVFNLSPIIFPENENSIQIPIGSPVGDMLNGDVISRLNTSDNENIAKIKGKDVFISAKVNITRKIENNFNTNDMQAISSNLNNVCKIQKDDVVRRNIFTNSENVERT